MVCYMLSLLVMVNVELEKSFSLHIYLFKCGCKVRFVWRVGQRFLTGHHVNEEDVEMT